MKNFYITQRVLTPRYEFRKYHRQLSAAEKPEQFWAIVPRGGLRAKAVLITADSGLKKLAIVKGELPDNLRKEHLPQFKEVGSKKLPPWVWKALKTFQEEPNIQW